MAPDLFPHQTGGFGASDLQRTRETTWTQPSSSQLQPLTRTGAGRKRSRDEAAVNLNDDALVPASITPIKESEEDWVYGEGMVLIKPNSGYVADASSQSGTWVEEKVAEEEARRVNSGRQKHDRPALRSHKSQRLGQGCAVGPGQEVPANPQTPSSGPSISTATFSTFSTLSSETSSPPVVDDFTLHLGIGWRRISDDKHIQAAARGWARYIENHYPLSAVVIRLESKGLQSYLVEASEGYYLLAENLKQARLVSSTAGGALANLKSSPPIFDGADTMTAAGSPTPVESPTEGIISPHPDVEMDLS